MEYDNVDDLYRRLDGMCIIHDNKFCKSTGVTRRNNKVVVSLIDAINGERLQAANIEDINISKFNFGNVTINSRINNRPVTHTVYLSRRPIRATREGLSNNNVSIITPSMYTRGEVRFSDVVASREAAKILNEKDYKYDVDRAIHMATLEAEEFDRDQAFAYGLSRKVSIMASREVPGKVIAYYDGNVPVGEFVDGRVILHNKFIHLRESIQRQKVGVQ